ncbi:MAG TPA: hypothetical protein PKA58_18185 [Polyangium sp.]|nr:hypothetical protein [Polyangium sp.]
MMHTQTFASKRVIRAICYSLSLAMPAACVGPDHPAPPGSSTIAPDCTRTGELGIAFGEGDREFMPLTNGAAPMLYHGPQGGTHLILASRVGTPDPLDRYVVTVVAEVGNAECTAQPCASYTKAGSIMRVVEGAPSVTVSGTNSADVVNLFVLVDGWLAGTQKRISISIADACDRKGSVIYEYSEGNGI